MNRFLSSLRSRVLKNIELSRGVGQQQGRKVFSLQTLPDCRPDNPFANTVGTVAGF